MQEGGGSPGEDTGGTQPDSSEDTEKKVDVTESDEDAGADRDAGESESTDETKDEIKDESKDDSKSSE